MNRSPFESKATARGNLTMAEVVGPLFPEASTLESNGPAPATVVMRPVVPLTRRTLLLRRSATASCGTEVILRPTVTRFQAAQVNGSIFP